MPSRLLGAAIGGMMVAMAASAAAPPVSDPMFPDGRCHDFGVVSRGAPARHTFRVVNTSGARLHIESLRSS